MTGRDLAAYVRFETGRQRRLAGRIKVDGRWFHPNAPHGKRTGYVHYGCRCGVCTAANKQFNRETRRRKRANRIVTPDGHYWHPDAPHGTRSGAVTWGCGCQECRDVNSLGTSSWTRKTITGTYRFHTLHPHGKPPVSCGLAHPTRNVRTYDFCPKIVDVATPVFEWLWHRPECQYTATAILSPARDITICAGTCDIHSASRVLATLTAAQHAAEHPPDDETDIAPNTEYDFTAFHHAGRELL